MIMSSHHEKTHLPPPLDLSGWRKLPAILMVVGGCLCVAGVGISFKGFGAAWLLAFIFYLSIALGALFLVLVHHLTDAGWSVGIRRFCEHIAAMLFPCLAILFIPVLLLGSKIYPWLALDPAGDRSLSAKQPVFTCSGFVIVSALFFGVWWLLSSRLRYWSLRQDVTGDALCTRKLRFHSGWGILAFAATLTGASVLWVKSLQYQWFSAIYGVYFFSDCAWITLATVYVITVLMQRQRILDGVLHDNQFYYLGVLFFAFTVFSAYTEFAQYFVVWNANMPEETFWYLIREHGSWWWLSLVLIFGHFFLPFFVMLPLKVKTNFKIMVAVAAWAWVMHFADLAFNILPATNFNGYPLKWIPVQFGCMAFMGGFLSWVFLKNFQSHPPYPQKDPRLLEAMGVSYIAPGEVSGATTVTGGHQ
jgi:hypothetical protein